MNPLRWSFRAQFLLGFLVYDLWRVLSGQLRGDALVMVKESEETAEFDALQARLAEEDRLAAAASRPAGAPDAPTHGR